MPYIENVKEFADRQACKHVQLRNGGLLFANGAQVLADGAMIDPPTEPAALARLRRAFLSRKVELKTAERDALTESVATQNEWHAMGVAPTADERFPNWEQHLETLAIEIHTLQEKLAEIDEKLPPHPGAAAYAARRDREREAARQTMERLQALVSQESL